jgi:hypothetical protein
VWHEPWRVFVVVQYQRRHARTGIPRTDYKHVQDLTLLIQLSVSDKVIVGTQPRFIPQKKKLPMTLSINLSHVIVGIAHDSYQYPRWWLLFSVDNTISIWGSL